MKETDIMKEFAALRQTQGIADVTTSIPTASVNQAASDSSAPNPAAKKKRSLPGNPDPKAEVIALSPKSLMATNKFVCEVCGKGFQRDQNLQLHRRGHNLPWKLKQRQSNEVVRKKVYICPERSCAHHDPSRALGDLTGIKKHFFRKHGEKRWSCDKCSKKYAVLSDWKAHSKICGTKEYRCDCGTIFSRRDSFITHRAFCDALAGEYSARKINANPLMFSDQNQLHLPQPTCLQNLEVISSSTAIDMNNSIYGFRPEMPQWLASAPTSLITQQIEQSMYSSNLEHVVKPSPDPSPTFPSHFQTSKPSSHFSATALLQKAAEMGATMSRPIISEQHGLFTSHQEMQGGDAFGVLRAISASSPLAQNNMVLGSFPSSSGFGGSFEETMGGMVAPKREEGNGSDGMTRDFLGLRAPSHKEIFSMAGIEYCMGSSSSFEHPRRI